MQRTHHVVAFALLASLAATVPAAAQAGATQGSVKIAYEKPKDAKFAPIHDRITKLKVLEELQAFMAPLHLPRDITVRTAQCGSENVHYKSPGPATVCYELIEKIERIAAARTQDPIIRQTVVIGGFVQATFHETAMALFDVLEVPIWGRRDDAADRLAAVVMMQFGDDVASTVMQGTHLLFQWSDQRWTGSAFASELSPDYQRFFNYACVAVAANWPLFGGLVRNRTIPQFRARRCDDEYAQIRKAFNLRIMPHMDADLLVKARATPWKLSLAAQQ